MQILHSGNFSVGPLLPKCPNLSFMPIRVVFPDAIGSCLNGPDLQLPIAVSTICKNNLKTIFYCWLLCNLYVLNLFNKTKHSQFCQPQIIFLLELKHHISVSTMGRWCLACWWNITWWQSYKFSGAKLTEYQQTFFGVFLALTVNEQVGNFSIGYKQIWALYINGPLRAKQIKSLRPRQCRN